MRGCHFLAAATLSDILTLGILGLVAGTLSVCVIFQPSLLPNGMLHIGMFVAFLSFIRYIILHENAPWIPPCRGIATVSVLFILYRTLAVSLTAIPWRADRTLSFIDTWLFLGINPSLWVEPHITLPFLEFFSFIYAVYIPFLYVAIFLGLTSRSSALRSLFLDGFAIVYAISFTGYLFAPAQGPIVYHADDFYAPLTGGFFYNLVADAIDAVGGPHGAFPSLHVGASAYLCLFDLIYHRKRGLLYLPFVCLIAVATIIVRYHYVIDLIGGLAIAAFSIHLTRRWQRHLQTLTNMPICANAGELIEK